MAVAVESLGSQIHSSRALDPARSDNDHWFCAAVATADYMPRVMQWFGLSIDDGVLVSL